MLQESAHLGRECRQLDRSLRTRHGRQCLWLPQRLLLVELDRERTSQRRRCLTPLESREVRGSFGVRPHLPVVTTTIPALNAQTAGNHYVCDIYRTFCTPQVLCPSFPSDLVPTLFLSPCQPAMVVSPTIRVSTTV